MRRLLFPIILAVSLARGFSSEEFAWVYTWHAWVGYIFDQDVEGFLKTYDWVKKGHEAIVPMPLLTEDYPQAAAQMDGLVKDAMKNHHSLDWALDNLKPSSGPAPSVPDSLRSLMLYFIYHDNFSRLERPWYWKGCLPIDWFFSSGTGTYDRGWGRYAYINTGPGEDVAELWFYGYCTISWAATGDTLMDSTRAVWMFNNSREKGMLVSNLSKPAWSPILGVQSDVVYRDYKIPAVQIMVPLEYDCCEVYPEVFRRSDTLVVTTFVRNGYEYLISYSRYPYGENFSSFLLGGGLVFNP